ncbi:hypothetical protein T02_15825 [Trichinella nativa]|uniref:Uncharacterized protein n=1 Tax=Trichinella nativa TaxID=6335 RepID=A0A0V1KZX9_9BILA|nr:hypothetical protein T02_15825 [Trichinella nativa]
MGRKWNTAKEIILRVCLTSLYSVNSSFSVSIADFTSIVEQLRITYQDYLNGVLLLFRKTNVQNDYKINYNGMLLRLSLMANLSSNERRQRRFIRLLLFS